MRCTKCNGVVRHPTSLTRETQKCGNCRGYIGTQIRHNRKPGRNQPTNVRSSRSHYNKAYATEYSKRPEVKQRRKEYEKSEKRKKWVEAYKPRKQLLRRKRDQLKKQTKITD